MQWRVILNRLVMLAVTVAVCWSLARASGPRAAVLMWTVGMAAVCGVTALLMKRQAPGRITPVNYLAGLVLPWGYGIGRGRLLPIVLTSWAIWALLGAGAVLALRGASRLVAVLLYLSWVVDAGVALRLIGFLMVKRTPIRLGAVLPITALLLLVVASVALAVLGGSQESTHLALILAGGPPLLIGGGYGLFLLVVLASGKHTSWH